MKPAILLTVFCTIAFAPGALAKDTFWKHFSRPDLATGLWIYDVKFQETDFFGGDEESATFNHFGAYIAWYLPVTQIADHLSTGLYPGLGLTAAPSQTVRDFSTGLTYSSGSNSIAFELPIFAMIKWGTDATWKGKRGFGFGVAAGIGYEYSYLIFPNSGETRSFGLPAAIFEINLGKRKSKVGLIKLRYARTLGTSDEEFFIDGVKVGTESFEVQSIQIAFTPGY